MNMKKKMMSCVVMIVMVVFGITGFVFAANSNNRNLSFTAYSAGFSSGTSRADKEDTSPLYLLVKSLSKNDSINVRAMGIKHDKSTNYTENGLTGVLTDHVVCIKGKEYSIHSQIKEHGCDEALLSFRSFGTYSEKVSGVWSPDSVGRYIHATK